MGMPIGERAKWFWGKIIMLEFSNQHGFSRCHVRAKYLTTENKQNQQNHFGPVVTKSSSCRVYAISSNEFLR